MIDREYKPKVCKTCKGVVDSYLLHCDDQAKILHVLSDLTMGVVNDEGIESEALARIGEVISVYLTKRAAIDWFFFGDTTVLHRNNDEALVLAEIAFVKARYSDLPDCNHDWNDPSDNSTQSSKLP